MKNALSAALLTALVVSLPTHADFMGGIDGRLAEFNTESQLSVEANASDFADMKWVGARINYQFSDTLMFFGEGSQLTLDSHPQFGSGFKGNAIGGGAVLSVEDVLPEYNTSVRVSYHKADLPAEQAVVVNGLSVNREIAITSMSAKLLISPMEPLGDYGMTWYASMGYVSSDALIASSNRATDTKTDFVKGIAAGFGIVYPISFGEVFVGYESLDGEGQVGGGVRYSF